MRSFVVVGSLTYKVRPGAPGGSPQIFISSSNHSDQAGSLKKSYSCKPEKKNIGDFTMDAQTRDPAGSHDTSHAWATKIGLTG